MEVQVSLTPAASHMTKDEVRTIIDHAVKEVEKNPEWRKGKCTSRVFGYRGRSARYFIGLDHCGTHYEARFGLEGEIKRYQPQDGNNRV